MLQAMEEGPMTSMPIVNSITSTGTTPTGTTSSLLDTVTASKDGTHIKATMGMAEYILLLLLRLCQA